MLLLTADSIRKHKYGCWGIFISQLQCLRHRRPFEVCSQGTASRKMQLVTVKKEWPEVTSSPCYQSSTNGTTGSWRSSLQPSLGLSVHSPLLSRCILFLFALSCLWPRIASIHLLKPVSEDQTLKQLNSQEQGEIAQGANYSPCQCEDLNSSPSAHFKKLGMMVDACNLSTGETQSGGSIGLSGQPTKTWQLLKFPDQSSHSLSPLLLWVKLSHWTCTPPGRQQAWWTSCLSLPHH